MVPGGGAEDASGVCCRGVPGPVLRCADVLSDEVGMMVVCLLRHERYVHPENK